MTVSSDGPDSPLDGPPAAPVEHRFAPVSPILRWFDYSHLPAHLQMISAPFHTLAWQIEGDLPGGPEKSTALRKLLEAKDAAVRAAVEAMDPCPRG